MRLFSALIGALLIALTAGQTTCTPDNCFNRVVNLGTIVGRAYCFTYLAGGRGSSGTDTVTTTGVQTVTARTTRTTTVLPPVTTTVRTSVTVTQIIAARQIIANSISTSVLAACTSSVLRISSACNCYLQRPSIPLAGL